MALSLRVHDEFTVSTNTDLDSHTPTEVGTGWVLHWQTGTVVARVFATGDVVGPVSDESDAGMGYYATPGPTDGDQDVEVLVVNDHVDESGVFARLTDEDNNYNLRIDTSAVRLRKVVSGTETQLGSYSDTNLDGQTVKLEIRDGAKKVFVDAIERISSTDNAITATGHYGLWWGVLANEFEDKDATDQFDDFKAWATGGTDAALNGVGGTLTFTGQVGNAAQGSASVVQGVAGSLTFIGQTGSVRGDLALMGVAGALSLTGRIGSARGDVAVAGLAGALAFTGQPGSIPAPPGESSGYDISVANAAAAADRVVRPVLLADLDFDSGDVLVTTAPFDIAIAGKTYRGVGHFGGISAVEEAVELQTYNLTLQLNGIPVSLVAIALGEDYQGRTALVSLAFLDEGHRPVDAPLVLFRGRMDVMRITAGETASIDLVCENRLADWERARVRRYNNADQQRVYDGDRFFEFVPQMVDKQLVWPHRSFFN